MAVFPPYAVREDVKQALDVLEVARADAEIDRQLLAAARAIDGAEDRRGGGRLHRVFFPTVDTRSFDWPNIQVAKPWRLWLNQNELIELTSASSGGIDIPLENIKLYPDWGPPFTRIELDVSMTSAFSASTTWQKSITLGGVFGFRDDQIPAGTVPATGIDTGTSINLGVPSYGGVGSLLMIDTERLLITDRSSTTTGQTLGTGGLAALANATALPVADITQFAIGETLLIDAESILVLDAAGTNLIVKRAVEGTALAAHTEGTTIYANRQLTVARGVLGTTPVAHQAGAAVTEYDPPALLRQLNVAQAVVNLIQTRAGYPMPMSNRAVPGTSPNKPLTRPSDLSDLWDQADAALGRHGRKRTI